MIPHSYTLWSGHHNKPSVTIHSYYDIDYILLPDFLIFVNLMSVTWHLTVILICISLNTSKIDHLFTCLPANPVSPSVRFPFCEYTLPIFFYCMFCPFLISLPEFLGHSIYQCLVCFRHCKYLLVYHLSVNFVYGVLHWIGRLKLDVVKFMTF